MGVVDCEVLPYPVSRSINNPGSRSLFSIRCIKSMHSSMYRSRVMNTAQEFIGCVAFQFCSVVYWLQLSGCTSISPNNIGVLTNASSEHVSKV